MKILFIFLSPMIKIIIIIKILRKFNYFFSASEAGFPAAVPLRPSTTTRPAVRRTVLQAPGKKSQKKKSKKRKIFFLHFPKEEKKLKEEMGKGAKRDKS